MRCKGCKEIEWVDDACDKFPSEVPFCHRLDRELTSAEYNVDAPNMCPYRDEENLGRGADTRHICYVIDERDRYRKALEKIMDYAKQPYYEDDNCLSDKMFSKNRNIGYYCWKWSKHALGDEE